MYQSYWGITRAPFSTAEGQTPLADSPVQAEALARLEFLADSRERLGLLLGPAGSGKSLLLADFAERTIQQGRLVALVNVSLPAEEHLLAALASGWQLECGHGKSWHAVVNRLEELKLENLRAVLLLDDLDRATPATLAAIEWLLSLPAAPLTIVGSARPETAAAIGQRLLEQAALRIDLAPWSEEEIRGYISASLSRAGRVQPAFNDAATRRLFELSGGIPRKVNRLAQLALVAGAGENLTQVDAQTMNAVHDELSV